MRAAGSIGVTLGLLSLVPGVRVGLSPYRSGWGKVRVGSTEYDLLDGVPSTVKTVAQLLRAGYRHAEGLPPVRTHGEEQSAYNLTRDFFRRRLSPSGQVAADYMTGKTVDGDRPTTAGELRELLAPFVLDEMYRGFEGEGLKGAVKALPSAVGVLSQTYGRADRLD